MKYVSQSPVITKPAYVHPVCKLKLQVHCRVSSLCSTAVNIGTQRGSLLNTCNMLYRVVILSEGILHVGC